MKYFTLALAVSAIPFVKREDPSAVVEVFEHPGFQGYTMIITLDNGEAKCKNIDKGELQDAISSAKWSVTDQSGICFHEHRDCGGSSKCFDRNALPIVDFRDQELNDKISSISLYTI